MKLYKNRSRNLSIEGFKQDLNKEKHEGGATFKIIQINLEKLNLAKNP